jgi:hypothetical protein
MIEFRCANGWCKRKLKVIVKLSGDVWWYACPDCGSQASIYAPYWETRYNLGGIEIMVVK